MWSVPGTEGSFCILRSQVALNTKPNWLSENKQTALTPGGDFIHFAPAWLSAAFSTFCLSRSFQTLFTGNTTIGLAITKAWMTLAKSKLVRKWCHFLEKQISWKPQILSLNGALSTESKNKAIWNTRKEDLFFSTEENLDASLVATCCLRRILMCAEFRGGQERLYKDGEKRSLLSLVH